MPGTLLPNTTPPLGHDDSVGLGHHLEVTGGQQLGEAPPGRCGVDVELLVEGHPLHVVELRGRQRWTVGSHRVADRVQPGAKRDAPAEVVGGRIALRAELYLVGDTVAPDGPP